MMLMWGCDQPTKVESNESKLDDTAIEAWQTGLIDGQYIISLKSVGSTETLAARAEKTDAQIDAVAQSTSIEASNILKRYTYSLRGFAAKLTDEQVNSLRKDDRVEYVEQDQVISLAPPCGTPVNPCDGGGGGDDSGQATPWGITRVGGPVASNGVAWVIDTGVDLDHPDLNVDTERSVTVISRGSGSKSADDGNGHGTHVAGTIAAIDNDIDVVGVASGATIVGVKVLDKRGSGLNSDVIAGVDYVAANAAPGDVANLSLGGSPSQALDDAVRYAADQGVVFAIAAGNSGDDANNYSPARVEYNNVWTVSATDEADIFADFSNYSGPTEPPIEFTGPGVDILSLYADGGTATLSGTSMASPHVAGVLLLTGGNPTSDGTASGDPDGDSDPIIHN
ncbi:S8 family peptidase [Aliifodinibius sp. S!AR15-10]|uniref:S8 family peptidase n=1 Tax=Aliifodinibius sp. S!AR15-10 TaxID=2950437 RepID=UPI002866091C|nr:S8 family peptidase [Aliifodinibius sp. S!AR15-10]MDR8393061.1 S8 family peptidase [Aliifodinibius sp. S!AR15-10]